MVSFINALAALVLFVTASVSTSALSNLPADSNLFIFTVDATVAEVTPAGSFQLPVLNTQYQFFWEEVGNEVANNSAGAVQVSTAEHVIDFGTPGIYRVGIDPVNVLSGGNTFVQFRFLNAGDKSKFLNISQWGTTQWSTMAAAFQGASAFTGFTANDTPNLSGLSIMSNMFADTPVLVDLQGIGSWDMSSVTHMNSMFKNAVAANPDTAAWNTSSATRMDSMFQGASVANPDTSGWNTSQVNDLSYMFYQASVATPATSTWNTSNVTNMTSMFFSAFLANPDTSGWDTSAVTAMSSMFRAAVAASPDTSGWNTSQVTTMQNMFFGAYLANPDTSGWNTSNVTSLSGMFINNAVAAPDTSGWNTSAVTNMSSLFRNALSANPDVSNWDTSSVTNMDHLFQGTDMATPDVSSWDTSSVTRMRSMFYRSDLANPDVSSWDTSLVTDFSVMFNTTLSANPDTSGFDTSSATDMSSMFYKAAVAMPDTSNWDVSSVTSMINMFREAPLANPDTSAWNTSSVTSMNYLFSKAYSADPDVSGWNTGAVTGMYRMFEEATSFDRPVDHFLMGSVTNAAQMFLDNAMTTANYDALLVSLSSQSLQSGVSFSGGGSTYCLSELERDDLTNNDSWVVSDGGLDCTDNILAEILEDSSSGGGGSNANGISITASELSAITGIVNVDAANESQYQSLIATQTGFSNPPTVTEVQAIIDRVGASQSALAEVLEDSVSTGGASNANVAFVSFLQLTDIIGLNNIENVYLTGYQEAFETEAGFSNLPSVSEIQAVVNRVNAYIPVNPSLFIFTVDATIADATAAGSFQLPVPNTNYQLYWSEIGNEEFNNSSGAVHVTAVNHTIDFGAPGNYRVAVDPMNVPSGTNDFNTFSLNGGFDKGKLLTVEQWGATQWVTMAGAFHGASAFTGFTATDAPVLSAVNSMSKMFLNTPVLVDFQGMGSWDVSSVMNMASIFRKALSANPDVSNWDTSQVTTMKQAFEGASSAMPDVSGWDTASVTTMESMFEDATLANPDVSSWDTSSVTNFGRMFNDAPVATPDTSGFDTSSATQIVAMFFGATSAMPDTASWDVSSVTNMYAVFRNASVANPDTSAWDTSSVTFMSHMFSKAYLANPDVSGWDTSLVANMSKMFEDATSFDGAIDVFDMGSVTDASSMFQNNAMSTANYDALLASLSTQTLQSGVEFGGGGSTYCLSESQRDEVSNNDSWNISDNGLNCTENTLAEILEDSSSSGGSANANGTLITANELSAITGILNVDSMNETRYQYHIAAQAGLSNPPTVAQVQVIIDAVNTSQLALAEVLEDSASTGGANNVNAVPVSLLQLTSILGLNGLDDTYLTGYQAAIKEESGFSNLPDAAEIQAIISRVNAYIPVNPNLFEFTVDASIADATDSGLFQLPVTNVNYQLYWTEIGNEEINNSSGAVHITAANHTIDFGAPGIYTIAIDPVDVPSGFNDFNSFVFDGVSDKEKLLAVEQWGTTAWTSMAGMFSGASNFTGFTAIDSPDFTAVSSFSYMFYQTPMMVNTVGIGSWDTSSITDMSYMFSESLIANPEVSNWNTENVSSFNAMFSEAPMANPDVSGWNTSAATTMRSMFQSSTAFTGTVDHFDMSNVISGQDMFLNVPSTTAEYDSLLAAWENQSLQSGVLFHAGNDTTYCESTSQHDALTDTKGWFITDGGLDCTVNILTEVLEDSDSVGGAGNINATPITVIELAGINGIANVVVGNETQYQAAIAMQTAFSNPPTITQVQTVITVVNNSQAALAELLEDSSSTGGASNANGTSITTAQLSSIMGVSGVLIANEAAYQDFITVSTTLSDLPSAAQVQAVLDTVNASQSVLAELLEDSSSTGGASNANGMAISALQLSSIIGVSGIDAANDAEYQLAIANATALSNLPTAAEVQVLITLVNDSEAALTTVLTSLSGATPATAAQLADITGVTAVDPSNEAEYQAAIAIANALSSPPTAVQIQLIVDAVNASKSSLRAILDASDSPSSSGQVSAESISITALSVITGISRVDALNGAVYQAAIATEIGFSNPPTLEEVQALVDHVNASEAVKAQILDTSSSLGSSGDSSTPVTAIQLASILGIVDVNLESEAGYQAAIASASELGNPPTLAQIQTIIDRVNDLDGDGISDAIEQGQDTDNDGVFDNLDLDSDNDGLSDHQEGSLDSDQDGLPNFRDLDSDNDGISDLLEAQRLGGLVSIADTNQDGMVDFGVALGTNGLIDSVETRIDSGIVIENAVDTDEDGVPDFRDLDSDNDGVVDAVEGLNDEVPLNDVFAGNNLLLNDAGTPPKDTDSDGVPDYRDGDSDNDGLLDVVESFGQAADANNDGQLDDSQDNDGNGLSDSWETNMPQPLDTDGDGKLNQLETDSDADGLSDLIESGGVDIDEDGVVDDIVDNNNDGIDDGVAIMPLLSRDTDNDGIPDHLDTDSDNDGVSDLVESGGIDTNGDGQAEQLTLGAALPDTDGNNVPNHLQASPDEFIAVGLGGSGCSISSSGSSLRSDPTIPALALLALSWIFLRLRMKNNRGAQISKTKLRTYLVLGAIVTLVATGCTSFSQKGNGSVASSIDKSSASLNDQANFRKRLWVSAGAGMSSLSPDVSQAPSVGVTDDKDTGGQVGLGIDISPRIAVELHAAVLGSAELSPGGSPKYSHTGGSALFYLGGKQRVSQRQGLMPYARVGYGKLAVSGSQAGGIPILKQNASEVLLGAGLEYAMSKGLGLRAEVISFQKDVQYAQFGLIYRFGKPVPAYGGPIVHVEPGIEKKAGAVASIPETAELIVASEDTGINTLIQSQASLKVVSCQKLMGSFKPVQFAYDSAGLTEYARGLLDTAADTLQRCPSHSFVLEGHTDNIGPAVYNEYLSEQRVASVLQYFEQKGLPAERFALNPLGETSPVMSNGTQQGRAANRRVSVIAQ